MGNRRKRRPGALLMGLGLLLLLAALAITGYNLLDERRADQSAQARLTEVTEAILARREEQPAPAPSDDPRPAQTGV